MIVKPSAEQQAEQQAAELAALPGHILRDLARNPSASYVWRKEAVRIMLEKGYREANHEDLVGFVNEIRNEQEARSEVVAVVESAIEAPLDEDKPVFPRVPGAKQGDGVPNPPQFVGSAKVSVQDVPSGPFSASVTTRSLMQDDVVGAEGSMPVEKANELADEFQEAVRKADDAES